MFQNLTFRSIMETICERFGKIITKTNQYITYKASYQLTGEDDLTTQKHFIPVTWVKIQWIFIVHRSNISEF